MTWLSEWLKRDWTQIFRADEIKTDEYGNRDKLGILVDREISIEQAEREFMDDGQGLTTGIALTKEDIQAMLEGKVLITYPSGGEYVVAVFVEID